MALQAAWAMIRTKFPGNFKIMDESLAGSGSDSAPATGRKGSHSKGEADLDAAIRDKEGSFTTRYERGVLYTVGAIWVNDKKCRGSGSDARMNAWMANPVLQARHVLDPLGTKHQ